MTRKTIAVVALAMIAVSTLAFVPALTGAQSAGNTPASDYTLSELTDLIDENVGPAN